MILPAANASVHTEPPSPKVLVTGAGGFVGRALLQRLGDRPLRIATRGDISDCPAGIERAVVGDIDACTDWSAALAGVEQVVHLAARVHVMDKSADDEALYEKTNLHGTRRLVQACVDAGVSRFVFMSTIKVNGEVTDSQPFRAGDPPHPTDAYARSKLRAEEVASTEGAKGGMQVAIVRPPLVYGPEVRANFRRLMSFAYRAVPLPLASVDNSRSLVSVWNLCDLVATLLRHDQDVHGLYLVSDGEDVSTAELLRRMARAMDRTPRLFRFPVTWLRTLARMAGAEAEVLRLTSSLQVDMAPTCRSLRWKPPLSLDEGLRRTARWYAQESVKP